MWICMVFASIRLEIWSDQVSTILSPFKVAYICLIFLLMTYFLKKICFRDKES